LAGVGILSWSACAWVAYSLIDMAGDWAGGATPYSVEPEVEAFAWLAQLAAGLGEAVVIVIWAAGTLAMAGIAAAATYLMERARMSRPA
jgi:hypothetical protein